VLYYNPERIFGPDFRIFVLHLLFLPSILLTWQWRWRFKKFHLLASALQCLLIALVYLYRFPLERQIGFVKSQLNAKIREHAGLK
jgi:glucose-6-phosphate-specific signal transduction histidine kinase